MAPANQGGGSANLVGRRIERLALISDAGRVVVPHSSNARYATSSDGRSWVRKRLGDTGFEALLAEALGWMLARELKVPVPAGAVTGEGDDLSWLSERIPFALHWDRMLVHSIKNLDGLGRMLALDALIHNGDRHARNILLEPRQKGLELWAWCIDVGDSMLGYPRDLAAAGLELPSTRNIARGLPVPLLRQGALDAAEGATLLTKALLRSMVLEACELVGEPDADALLEALWHRMRHAPQLVDDYLVRIEESS